MPGKPIGTIFVELDLDPTKYKGKMRQILQDATTTSLDVEKNWRTLGGKSAEMFDLQRKGAMNAFEAIRQSALRSGKSQKDIAMEITRAEAHKNDIIMRLNKEQYDAEGRLGARRSRMSRDTQAGWMSMLKGMLAYRVILEGIQLAQQATIGTFRDGIKAVDDFRMAQASMAGAIASSDPSIGFDKAFQIAKGLNQQIELLDRQFIGTADELRVLADSMLTFGMGIDLSNKHAQDQFVTFANTIKLLTRGQDFQRQAMQEVRALMEGSNVQGALLVKKINAAGYDAKKMIPIWKEQGTLMEHINEIFGGYAQAGAEIEKTLNAQKGTMETIYKKVLREGFSGAYEDIVRWMTKYNDSMLTGNGLSTKAWNIVEGIRTTWEVIKYTIIGLGTTIYLAITSPFKAAYEVVEDILEVLEKIGQFRTPTEMIGVGDMGVTAGFVEPPWTPKSLEDERDKWAARGGMPAPPLVVPPTGGKVEETAFQKAQRKWHEEEAKRITELQRAEEDLLGLPMKDMRETPEIMAAHAHDLELAMKNVYSATTGMLSNEEELDKFGKSRMETMEEIAKAGGEAAYQAQLMADNFERAFDTGNISEAIEIMNSGYGEMQAALEGQQEYIATYRDMFMEAHRSMYSYAAEGARFLYQNVSSALTNIITGVASAKDAFKELGQAMIRMILEWIIQRTIAFALSKVMAAVEVAIGVATGAALAAAYAPAAYFASVMTFGGAAEAGMAALLGNLAIVQGVASGISLSNMVSPGGHAYGGAGSAVGAAFAHGTDYVPATMPAIVHEGERVVPEETNKDLTDFLGGGGGGRGQTIQLLLDGRELARWINDQSREGTLQLRPA